MFPLVPVPESSPSDSGAGIFHALARAGRTGGAEGDRPQRNGATVAREACQSRSDSRSDLMSTRWFSFFLVAATLVASMTLVAAAPVPAVAASAVGYDTVSSDLIVGAPSSVIASLGGAQAANEVRSGTSYAAALTKFEQGVIDELEFDEIVKSSKWKDPTGFRTTAASAGANIALWVGASALYNGLRYSSSRVFGFDRDGTLCAAAHDGSTWDSVVSSVIQGLDSTMSAGFWETCGDVQTVDDETLQQMLANVGTSLDVDAYDKYGNAVQLRDVRMIYIPYNSGSVTYPALCWSLSSGGDYSKGVSGVFTSGGSKLQLFVQGAVTGRVVPVSITVGDQSKLHSYDLSYCVQDRSSRGAVSLINTLGSSDNSSLPTILGVGTSSNQFTATPTYTVLPSRAFIRVKCDDGNTYTTYGETHDSTTDLDSLIPPNPEIPDTCDPTEYETGVQQEFPDTGWTDVGSTNTLAQPDVIRDWSTKYPQCTTGTCQLILKKVVDGQEINCFDQPDACADWRNESTTGTGVYRCYYAGGLMELSECNVYGSTFQTTQVQQGTGYSDPTTGEPQRKTTTENGTTTTTNVKTNPGIGLSPEAGGASDTSSDACWPSGWSVFNPLEWVLQPMKCALKWAFVPKTATLTSTLTEVIGQDTGVGQYRTMIANWSGLATEGMSSGCQGPHLVLSYYGTGYDGYPLNACSEPMSTAAFWSRTMITVTMWMLVLTSVTRNFAMIWGYTGVSVNATHHLRTFEANSGGSRKA